MALLHDFARRVNFTKFKASFVSKILCICTPCVWVTSQLYTSRIAIFLETFMRIDLSSTRNQWIRSPKPHLFEIALQSGFFLDPMNLVNSCGRLKPDIFEVNNVRNSPQDQMKTYKFKMTVLPSAYLHLLDIVFFSSSILSEYLNWSYFHSMFSCRRWLFLSKVRLHRRSRR